MNNRKLEKRIRRHKRIRAKISGSDTVPRVSIFRSNKNIFAQIIDDNKRMTIFSTHDVVKTKSGTKSKRSKVQKAEIAGEELAKKVKESGMSQVVFDRGGYKYHGRIKAFAEGLRKGGLKF